MVSQLARDRRIESVQNTQSEVGIHRSIDLDLQGIEGRQAAVHPLGRGHGKRPPAVLEQDRNLVMFEGVVDLGPDLPQRGSDLLLKFVHRFAIANGTARVEDAERERIEFRGEVAHAEMPGQGNVDRPGLFGDQRLLVRIEGADGLQVVHPVPELEAEDPDVLDGEQQLLAVGLRFEGLAAELVIGRLGQTVDQQRHLGAEGTLDLGQGDRGVLDDVVQDGGHHRGKVHPVPRRQMGHTQGVKEIGLPRFAVLPAMR